MTLTIGSTEMKLTNFTCKRVKTDHYRLTCAEELPTGLLYYTSYVRVDGEGLHHQIGVYYQQSSPQGSELVFRLI